MEEDKAWLGKKIRNEETRKWEKHLERISGWEKMTKSRAGQTLELTVNTVAQQKTDKRNRKKACERAGQRN